MPRPLEHAADLVKASKWLHAYPAASPGSLVVEDFYHKRRFAIDEPALLEILAFCGDFRAVPVITAYAINTLGLTESDAKQAIGSLCEKGLLIDADSLAYRKEALAKSWQDFGWDDALDYHVAIQDYPFLDYENDQAFEVDSSTMEEYAEEAPPPPIYKEYTHAKRINLRRDPQALDRTDLWDALDRKTASNQQLTLDSLSTLLEFVFGRTGSLKFPVQGEFLLKTSPSGGARHPIEAYVLNLDIAGLPRGAYHYSVRRHCLERMDATVSTKTVEDLFFETKSDPSFTAEAVLVLTAVFPRSMWRYREPRSYRVVLHDLGHVLETATTVATALNLQCYHGHGFRDGAVEELLGITKGEESALRFIALG